VTPADVFFNRRKFIKTLGLSLASAPLASLLKAGSEVEGPVRVPFDRPDVFPATRNPKYRLNDSLGSDLTPRETAASHNNFYEFIPGTAGPVWKHTDDFRVDPWKIKVTGQCHNPMTLDLNGLFAFAHEERLYHFRCVERWAMNVPWSGFPLGQLIEKADPKSSARFLRFTSLKHPGQMPGMRKDPDYPWPYREALRLDEAMNPLAMIVTGVYGEPLPKQHGAPVRIIVPWKYGYKSPKSIVKIEFLSKQPKTFWQIIPHEYGFISNVNPNIPHPRWAQTESLWLGKGDRFPTPIFNGYEEYVAELYPDEPRTPQKALKRGQKAR